MILDSKLRNLIELYVKKGLDDNEVADLLGCCQTSKYKFSFHIVVPP